MIPILTWVFGKTLFGVNTLFYRRLRAKYGGQNIGFSSRSGDDDSGDWKTAISRWFSEVKYFKFGAGSIDPKHKVGDYAQVQ